MNITPLNIFGRQSHQKQAVLPSLQLDVQSSGPTLPTLPPRDAIRCSRSPSPDPAGLSLATNRSANPSHNWQVIYAPLGTKCYYYHTGKRVVLDNEPDESVRREIEHATAGVEPPAESEWYRRKDGNVFYIDHTSQIAVFIVGPWQIPPKGATANLDARKSKYWEFVRKHPFHLRYLKHAISNEARNEAVNALSLILGMHALGPKPPFTPFSKSQCHEMRKLLTLDSNSQPGETQNSEFEYCTYVVAAILEQIYAQRFWCKNQLNDKRIDTVPKSKREKAWRFLVKYVLYPLLWGIPLQYQQLIERTKLVRIGKDEIPFHHQKDILSKAKQKYQISFVLAFLLLGASTFVVAIHDKDAWTSLFAGTAAQCSFASVILNMIALWQYDGTLEDERISNRLYFKRDIPFISCLHSLPFATLLWGLMFFGVGACLLPFNSGKQGGLDWHKTQAFLMNSWIFSSVLLVLLGIAILVAFTDMVRGKILVNRANKAKDRRCGTVDV